MSGEQGVRKGEELIVPPLGQMTVVIGANGSGKTALLQQIMKGSVGKCTYLSGRLPTKAEVERWIGWLEAPHELRKLSTLLGFIFPEVVGICHREGTVRFVTVSGGELSSSKAPGGWVRCAVILAAFLLVDPPGPFMVDNADAGLDPGAWSQLFSVLNREGAELGVKTVLSVCSPFSIDEVHHEDILCAVREGERTRYKRLVDSQHYECYCGNGSTAFTSGEFYFNERLWEARSWSNKNSGEHLKIELPLCCVQLEIGTGGGREATVVNSPVGRENERLPAISRALGYELEKLDGKVAGECAGEFDRALKCLEDGSNRREFFAMLPGGNNLWVVTDLMKWLRDSCRRHPKCTVRVIGGERQ